MALPRRSSASSTRIVVAWAESVTSRGDYGSSLKKS